MWTIQIRKGQIQVVSRGALKLSVAKSLSCAHKSPSFGQIEPFRKLLRRALKPHSPFFYGFLIPVPPLNPLQTLNCLRIEPVFDYTCRTSGNNGVGGHIFRHRGIRRDYRTIVDCHPAHNGDPISNPDIILNDNGALPPFPTGGRDHIGNLTRHRH